MKSNIDSVLKPYADEQPEKLSMQYSDTYKCIERIPPIVDHNGITDEFQTFYNKVVESITENSPKMLYEISDKVLDYVEFENTYQSTLGQRLSEILDHPRSERGLDIELNLGRFKQIHRNIIGGFYISTYVLEDCKFNGICAEGRSLKQEHAEILFTYKEGEFVIISAFSELVVD